MMGLAHHFYATPCNDMDWPYDHADRTTYLMYQARALLFAFPLEMHLYSSLINAGVCNDGGDDLPSRGLHGLLQGPVRGVEGAHSLAASGHLCLPAVHD